MSNVRTTLRHVHSFTEMLAVADQVAVPKGEPIPVLLRVGYKDAGASLLVARYMAFTTSWLEEQPATLIDPVDAANDFFNPSFWFMGREKAVLDAPSRRDYYAALTKTQGNFTFLGELSANLRYAQLQVHNNLLISQEAISIEQLESYYDAVIAPRLQLECGDPKASRPIASGQNPQGMIDNVSSAAARLSIS